MTIAFALVSITLFESYVWERNFVTNARETWGMLPSVEALFAGGQKALGLGALLPELQLPGGRVVDEEDGRGARPVPAQRHQYLGMYQVEDCSLEELKFR